MVCIVLAISRIGLLCGLSAVFTQVSLSSAGEPDEKKQIATWIEQLGSDSFRLREEAMAALIAIGDPIEKRVRAAFGNQDPEVRYRSRNVLRSIASNQLAKRRLAFLEGDIQKLKINAQSWQRYSQLIGNTRKSRELFLQMQIAGADLLDEAEKNPGSCAQLISQMYLEDAQMRRFGGQGMDPGRVAAMVFIAGDKRVPLDATATSRSVSLLYRYRTHFDEDATAFRQLLGHWMTSKATAISQQYQFLRLAQQYQLKEGVELARKMLNAGGSSSYRVQAMLTLGKLGTRDDVAFLEKQTANNSTVASTGNKTMRKTCKLGDIALAMCVVLSEQKLADFGFQNVQEGRPVNTSYVQYGFYSEEQRVAARKKWETWSKSQKPQ